ncbi:MAG: hypothetical protein ACR2KG_10125 [Nocardioidaceae bacterium]
MLKHIPHFVAPFSGGALRRRASRRRWFSVAVLSVAALTLSGCGGGSAPSASGSSSKTTPHPSVKTVVTIPLPTPPTSTATTGKKSTKKVKSPTLRKPVVLSAKTRFVRLLWLGPKCVGHLGDKPSEVNVKETKKLVKLSLTGPKCGVPGGSTVQHALKIKLSKGIGKRKVQVSMKPYSAPSATKSTPPKSTGPTTPTASTT